MSIHIRPLAPENKAAWLSLWQGYLHYYKTNLDGSITATTWDNILDPSSGINGLGAVDENGTLIGFTHYFFHPVTWSKHPRCYLEDLFTAKQARGKGAGRALISAVAEAARQKNASQLYWLTEDFNTRAHGLYDKVAEKTPFIKYKKLL